MDTKKEHRAHAEGSPRGNPYDLTYSPSGRLIGKFRDNNSVTLSATVDMTYGYCNEYQPHAVKRMFDYKNGMLYDMRWDEAGNLGQVSLSKTGKMFEAGRFLFWTEDSRMHAAIDEKFYSYYTYDHSGGSCASREQSQACLSYAEMEQHRRSQRRLKLTGKNELMDVNADFMVTYTVLNEPTLYPSAYMVLNNKGYTKHYYAGTERVAARLGGGGLNALQPVIANDDELQWKADRLFKQSLEQVNYRVLGENDLNCIMRNKFSPEVLGKWIEGIPYHARADVETEYWQFKEMVNSMLYDRNQGHEKEVYFYHSDHLGSASWITDGGGMAVQHIQYLPYGEPYINQRPFGYSERFTFTGKERDEETGYGYFGARYMDHELMTMWLSVDPMADKYPSISPYAYCAWNPIKLVDPDGNFPAPSHAIMVFKAFLKTGVSGIMKIGPKNILKMCWGASIVADVFHSGRSQVHLDNFNNQNGDLTSAYNNAISDYHNALSDGDYVRAGEALHTVADFYAHSDYVEKYDEFSKQKELSSDINDIPTFSDAQENAEFMSKKGGALKTGYWPDKPDDTPNSHAGMSKDTKRYPAGKKQYRGTMVNRHEAAKATAQKALDKIVGDE